MKSLLPFEFSKESQINALNPQSWLQAERGKSPSFASHSSSESLIRVGDPPLLPFFKPLDYVAVLARIHEELESCPPHSVSGLYLTKYNVFKGLGDAKLMRRNLILASQKAFSVHEKIIFNAWLKYEKRNELVISDLLSDCGKPPVGISLVNVAAEIKSPAPEPLNSGDGLKTVVFKVKDARIVCDRQKMAGLSVPFRTMLNGTFSEWCLEEIDLTENGISPEGFNAVREFTVAGKVDGVPPDVLFEVLDFANKFCCEGLKDACDRHLAEHVLSMDCAVELMEYAFEENSGVLAASCLQAILQEIPGCLKDDVAEMFASANPQQRKIMAGDASFALYSFLTEVTMKVSPNGDQTVSFLEILVDCAGTTEEKTGAFHQLGCVRFSRKEYEEAERWFHAAFEAGHVYSAVGLARVMRVHGNNDAAYETLSNVIQSSSPLGWMFLERSLYCEGDKKSDLDKATELDPTMTYPYMYRAAELMKRGNVPGALDEINRILGFKLALECLELRFCFFLSTEDYSAALCDVQAILTLSPEYRMLEGRVAAAQMRELVREHVRRSTAADCWFHLYEKWSSVDDFGSLSVVYQMLESEAAKGVLYFRQSLLLLRLNCPEAAMRSLQMAREYATTEHERLVYEGWILYDSGNYREGLQKAEESIAICRSFEAFFLKAYALADSSSEPSCSSTVVALLQEALKCPSDRLRKGQALNNLGSIYVDCESLDLAGDCYRNALNIRHTRAHQGLARVHYLRNDKAAAYSEMTKLIEKAKNNASAYEKRSEYADRELAKADLEMVTRLDPLRAYPYRYRAAVLMDSHKEKEAIAELSRAIAFKPDLHLLHLRAAFHEHIGDVVNSLRDCRAALSIEPGHQEILELHSRVNSSYEP